MPRLVLERTGTTIVILDTRAITASHSHRALTVVPGQGRSEEGPLTGKHRPEATIDIRKERVLIWNQSMVKQEAMKKLLDSFRLPATVREPAWQALVSREKQGGTFLGEDVTIPHARIAEIEQPLVALGICRKGIVDDLEAHTFKIMVLFLSPTNQPESHLLVLQAIGRMAQDDILRRRLLAAEDPAEVAGIVGES